MSDEVKCSNCGSTRVESVRSEELKTGDGTPVLATSFECLDCGWHFIHNEVAGPTPTPQEGGEHG
jgi:hypothetical protein